MKNYLKEVRPEHFLWGVVLAKLAADPLFPWGAVPVLVVLLLKPFAATLLEHWLQKQASEQRLVLLEQKLTDLQNRMASLSLAAGLKPRQ